MINFFKQEKTPYLIRILSVKKTFFLSSLAFSEYMIHCNREECDCRQLIALLQSFTSVYQALTRPDPAVLVQCVFLLASASMFLHTPPCGCTLFPPAQPKGEECSQALVFMATFLTNSSVWMVHPFLRLTNKNNWCVLTAWITIALSH